MGIDASIYNNVRVPQQVDPLARFAQFQQASNAMGQSRLADLAYGEKERALKEEEQMRGIFQQSGGDMAKAREGAYSSGNYKQGMALDKAMAEQKKVANEGEETIGKIRTEKLKTFRGQLESINDPQTAAQWITAQHQDPHLGPLISKISPLDKALANIQSLTPETFQKWKQQNIMGMEKIITTTETGRHNRAMEELKGRGLDRPGAQPMQPVAYVNENGETVWGTIKEGMGKPAANYSPSVQGSVAGAKEAGKGAGEFNMKQYESAQAAVPIVKKIDEQLKIINSGNTTTGFAADLRNDANRAIALLGSKAAKGKVSDTEVLESMMGSDVFGMITALGIGARGLDTPAEREFMRQVLTGTKSLNQETLRRMAEIRRDVATRTIEKFNKRIDNGELDRFFTASGLPKRRIEFDQAANTQQSSQAGTGGLSPAEQTELDQLRARFKK